nr:Ran GTPase activating protein 2 [Tanacetum cinerariifolium]
MDTCLDMKSIPEVYIECSKLTSEKDYLTVPFEFAGYNALLSLDVRIKKISISSEFDEEVKQVAGEALGNDDDDNPLGSLLAVLINPDTLDCSNCQEPLTTHIYQKRGTLEPEENTFFHTFRGKQAFIKVGEGQEFPKPLQEPGNKYLNICFRNRSFGSDVVHVAAPILSLIEDTHILKELYPAISDSEEIWLAVKLEFENKEPVKREGRESVFEVMVDARSARG